MPKIILSLDNNQIKEFEISKSETTIGRRSSNDVQIQNLAISGRHAKIILSGNDIFLEDLNSTNGTYVNGCLIKKQALNDGDEIIIGKYKLEYFSSATADAHQVKPAQMPTVTQESRVNSAIIEVKNGAKAGQILPIEKPVTTLGRPGIQIAAIMKKPEGYFFMHIESEDDSTPARHNKSDLGEDPVLLRSGDSLTVAGINVEFMLS